MQSQNFDVGKLLLECSIGCAQSLQVDIRQSQLGDAVVCKGESSALPDTWGAAVSRWATLRVTVPDWRGFRDAFPEGHARGVKWMLQEQIGPGDPRTVELTGGGAGDESGSTDEVRHSQRWGCKRTIGPFPNAPGAAKATCCSGVAPPRLQRGCCVRVKPSGQDQLRQGSTRHDIS